jgi:uncharacterized coiled-coil DUF342 family protein
VKPIAHTDTVRKLQAQEGNNKMNTNTTENKKQLPTEVIPTEAPVWFTGFVDILTGKIDGVRYDLTEKIDGVRSDLTALQGQVSELGKQVGEVRSELTEKIDGVRSELTEKIDGVRSELTEQIGEVRSDVNTLKGQVSELGKQVGEVRSELTEQIGEVRSELTEKIDGVRSELTEKIDGVRSELTEQIGEVRSDVKILKKQVSELGKQVGGLGQTLGKFSELVLLPNIKQVFREKGYDVTGISQNEVFGDPKKPDAEVDVLIKDHGRYVAVEVKTSPSEEDIVKCIRRLPIVLQYLKKRDPQFRSLKGGYVGLLPSDEVQRQSLEAGLYTLVTTGVDAKSVDPPDFEPREFYEESK